MFKKIKEIYKTIKIKFNKIEDPFFMVDSEYEDFLKKESKKIINKKTEIQDIFMPYFKSFAYNEVQEKTQEELFEKEGRPFSNENYQKIFNKLISNENFFKDDKEKYLKKIWEDAKYINDLLNPLKKLGLRFSLDLTGGCARDFVLDKHREIKDLDFMLSFQGYNSKTLDEINTIFTPEELNKINWNCDYRFKCSSEISENTTHEEKTSIKEEDIIKSKLLQLCVNRSKNILEVYDNTKKRFEIIKKNGYEEDIFKKERLLTVIKFSGENTNYPIDILLTDFSKNDFINDFDFDICKASICFVNSYVQKEFPKTYKELISRFIAKIDFFADIYNKTITYNVIDRNEKLIDQSFDNHLDRIIKKYPEYNILIAGDSDCKKYAETKLMNFKLNKELSIKDNNKRKNKI